MHLMHSSKENLQKLIDLPCILNGYSHFNYCDIFIKGIFSKIGFQITIRVIK